MSTASVPQTSSFSLSSPSRPSSRSSARSVRAPSPSIALDDPLVVRMHMSTLKHSIRHQQAQLHTLENVILAGPRPLPRGIMSSSSYNPEDDNLPAYLTQSTNGTTTKLQRRTSYDVLQSLAGPDSNLPLPLPATPRREPPGTPLKSDGIKEGVPMDFGGGSLNSSPYKRVSSPTRGGLSRIPVSAVADEGQPATSRSGLSPIPPPIDLGSANGHNGSASLQPPSPSKRMSMGPGGTTKVLADLQTGVINARNALENTKGQLRLSQRSVAQLTRQTEDLKEGRERLRLENEGLNNVVARKERLLQEVLERARKAETEAAALKTQLKAETTTSKKAIRDMETSLLESTAVSQKSEREYLTLRDSIKHLAEGWKADTEKLREEMRKREEQWKKEAEEVGTKYKKLLEDIKASQGGREEVSRLREEDVRIGKEVEDGFRKEIDRLKAEVEKSTKESDAAGETARSMSNELARLRRLMQSTTASRSPSLSTFPTTLENASP